MNKQEIEQILVRTRVAKTTIKNNIIELLEQLVEAEKPKLRHGDFGFGNENWPRLTLEGYAGEEMSAGKQSCERMDCTKHNYPDPVLGNIFDLLKEWSKDLGEFEKVDVKCKNRKVLIEKSAHHIAHTFIAVTDNDGDRGNGAHLSLSELENLWHKLGQMIATLKRKSK
jgi:hypothetical protein